MEKGVNVEIEVTEVTEEFKTEYSVSVRKLFVEKFLEVFDYMFDSPEKTAKMKKLYRTTLEFVGRTFRANREGIINYIPNAEEPVKNTFGPESKSVDPEAN